MDMEPYPIETLGEKLVRVNSDPAYAAPLRDKLAQSDGFLMLTVRRTVAGVEREVWFIATTQGVWERDRQDQFPGAVQVYANAWYVIHACMGHGNPDDDAALVPLYLSAYR